MERQIRDIKPGRKSDFERRQVGVQAQHQNNEPVQFIDHGSDEKVDNWSGKYADKVQSQGETKDFLEVLEENRVWFNLVNAVFELKAISLENDVLNSINYGNIAGIEPEIHPIIINGGLLLVDLGQRIVVVSDRQLEDEKNG